MRTGRLPSEAERRRKKCAGKQFVPSRPSSVWRHVLRCRLGAAAAAPVVKRAVPSQEKQKRGPKGFPRGVSNEIKEIKQPKTLDQKVASRPKAHPQGRPNQGRSHRPVRRLGNGWPITWAIWIRRSRPLIGWPKRSKWTASRSKEICFPERSKPQARWKGKRWWPTRRWQSSTMLWPKSVSTRPKSLPRSR